MKKTNALFLLLAIFCCQSLYAQKYVVVSGTKKHIPISSFPWTYKDKSMGNQQLNLADSIYTSLASGEAIRFNLLDETEENLSSKEIAQLTYARAEAFIKFCLQKNIPQTDFYAEIVPYDMPNTIRTFELENRPYKAFMSTNARTYFVFNRPISLATTKPSVIFDANVTNDVQKFSMYHDRNIYAYLNSGTTIFIPEGSLQFANGQKPSCEKVELRIAEYLDMDAMVMKAMTTSSYGKKLQTGGMWHIEVSCNGQPLFIKPGKQYHIYVDIKGEVKDMHVFTGNTKDGLLDWKHETDSKVYKPGESAANYERENDSTSNEGERDYETAGLGVIGFEAPSHQYDLALNDFGWINCDAFDNTKSLSNLMVHGDLKDHEVMLVYSKRKSVLPGYLCDDGRSVKFSDIATDEPAMLVVFKKSDDKGNVVKHIRMIDPSITTTVNVTTTESTLALLQAEIKSQLSDY